MTENKSGDTMSPIKKQIAEILKERENTADFSAEAYLHSERIDRRKRGITLIVSIIVGVVLAGISLCPELFGLSETSIPFISKIVAFISLGVAFSSVFDSIFGWSENIASYQYAFKAWKSYRQESRWFRKNQLNWMSDDDAKSNAEAFNMKYYMLVRSLPPNSLTGKTFLKFEKAYYLKRDISKRLDDDHYLNIDREWDGIGSRNK
ncbi:MAG: hypothetical protein IJA20_09320 [Methanocorpusculum sp.]|nr:hypothetical protein [Methanocorpusculum sp.]